MAVAPAPEGFVCALIISVRSLNVMSLPFVAYMPSSFSVSVWVPPPEMVRSFFVSKLRPVSSSMSFSRSICSPGIAAVIASSSVE